MKERSGWCLGYSKKNSEKKIGDRECKESQQQNEREQSEKWNENKKSW